MGTRGSLLVLLIQACLYSCDAQTQSYCSFGTFSSRDSCGYKSERAQSQKIFEWAFGISCTPSKNTGPCSDHTGDDKGAYLFTEASYRANGMIARWASPLYVSAVSDSGGCVQFYYHMYGVDIGTLNVYVFSPNNTDITWSKMGEQGNLWLRADIELNYPLGTDQVFQVIFEGVIRHNKSGLPEVLGDIAIDDITVQSSGRCGQQSETAPPTVYIPETTTIASATAAPDIVFQCSFESDTCGFENSNKDKGFWSRFKGRTPTANTGPTYDNTYKNASGYYMYFLASSVTRQGDNGILNSPQFNGGSCLRFFYNMNGADVTALNIYADVDALDVLIWTASGNQGDRWLQATVPLPANTVVVSFEGSRGASTASDVAIDDVSVSTIPCPGYTLPPSTTTAAVPVTTPPLTMPAFIACDFNVPKNLCGFSVQSGDYTWSQTNRKLRSIATGPTFDHTNGDLTGYFLLADAGYRKSGESTSLRTGRIDVSSSMKVCLKFYYHMYGADMGSLNVKVLSSGGSTIVEQTISGDKGDKWLPGSIDADVGMSPVISLQITAVLQHNKPNLQIVLSNIGIDDIAILPGTCAAYPGELYINTLLTPTPESSTASTSSSSTTASTPAKDVSTASTTRAQALPSPATTRNVPISATTQKTTPRLSKTTERPLKTNTPLDGSISGDPALDIGIIVAIVLSVTAIVGGVVVLVFLKIKQVGPFKNSSPFTVRFMSKQSKLDKMAFAPDVYDGDVSIHST